MAISFNAKGLAFFPNFPRFKGIQVLKECLPATLHRMFWNKLGACMLDNKHISRLFLHMSRILRHW